MSVLPSDVQQIYTDNPGGLPAVYDALSDISVQSVVARIDGSGAAGSFLPTLSLYSQDGKLIARVPSDVTYAVGDTGVVTWSPFLARRISTAPPSGAIIQYIKFRAPAVSVGPGATTLPFVINDDHTDGTVFDVTGGGNPRVLVPGFYAFHFKVNGGVSNIIVNTSYEFIGTTVAGSHGNWSSEGTGMFVRFAAEYDGRINHAGAGDTIGGYDSVYAALAAWNTFDTFPVETTWTAEKFEDGASVNDTMNFQLYVAQLGQPFS